MTPREQFLLHAQRLAIKQQQAKDFREQLQAMPAAERMAALTSAALDVAQSGGAVRQVSGLIALTEMLSRGMAEFDRWTIAAQLQAAAGDLMASERRLN